MNQIMVKSVVLAAALIALTACGGGGSDGNGGNTTPSPPPSSFTIGGTINGLTGTLVLQNNSGDDLTVSANGSFTFAGRLARGAAYNVTVKTQPTNPDQSCAISSGSGAIAAANVTNVAVTCRATGTA